MDDSIITETEWDEAFRRLAERLGRAPTDDEVDVELDVLLRMKSA